MCIIIDANMAHKLGNPRHQRPPDAAARQVLNRLIGYSGLKLALGGKLAKEVLQLRVMQELVNELEKTGRVYKYDNKAIRERTKILIDAEACKSDDQHVIALAQVSRARLLYSQDRKLCLDFTNSALIAHPVGRVYQRKADAHLLDNPPACSPPRAR